MIYKDTLTFRPGGGGGYDNYYSVGLVYDERTTVYAAAEDVFANVHDC